MGNSLGDPFAHHGSSPPKRTMERLSTIQWSALAKRSLVLKAISDYRLSLDVHSDSLSVDPDWNVTRLALSVRIQVGDAVGTLNVDAVCEPLVRVRGLYEIPGRPERIVVVSYIGRAYGCEEIDTLVLIPE